MLLNGAAGFHVVARGRADTRWRPRRLFQHRASNDAAKMAAFLKSVTPRELVFIAAVSPPGKATIDVSANRPVLGELATAIASVGGTRDLFNRSGIAPDSNYSLVGWGGAGEGNGQETSRLRTPLPRPPPRTVAYAARCLATISNNFKPAITSTAEPATRCPAQA